MDPFPHLLRIERQHPLNGLIILTRHPFSGCAEIPAEYLRGQSFGAQTFDVGQHVIIELAWICGCAQRIYNAVKIKPLVGHVGKRVIGEVIDLSHNARIVGHH